MVCRGLKGGGHPNLAHRTADPWRRVAPTTPSVMLHSRNFRRTTGSLMDLTDHRAALELSGTCTHALWLDTIWTGYLARGVSDVREEDRAELSAIGLAMAVDLEAVHEKLDFIAALAIETEQTFTDHPDQLAIAAAVMPGLIQGPSALKDLVTSAIDVLRTDLPDEIEDLLSDAWRLQHAAAGEAVSADPIGRLFAAVGQQEVGRLRASVGVGAVDRLRTGYDVGVVDKLLAAGEEGAVAGDLRVPVVAGISLAGGFLLCAGGAAVGVLTAGIGVPITHAMWTAAAPLIGAGAAGIINENRRRGPRTAE